MNTITKTIIAAVGAALFTAAPTIANADRVYFLVGTRHIYRIGHFQYDHLDDRRQIEQQYADQVASDENTYNTAIQGGADPDVEGPQLNQALADLSTDRDNRLGAIFENVDYERVRHPELQIEGEGPYQVMAINFHWRGDFEVFDNFYVYAPWPGYVVVGRPYGWAYGVSYTPGVFVSVYTGWHQTYIAAGRPPFVGIVGVAGPIQVSVFARAPGGGFIRGNANFRGGSRPGFNSGAPSRYGKPAGAPSRYGNPGAAPSRYGNAGGAPSRYSNQNPGSRISGGNTNPPSRNTGNNPPSRYGGSRGGTSPSIGGGSTGTPSRYSHSANPSSRTTGSKTPSTKTTDKSKSSSGSGSKPPTDDKKKG